MMSAKSRAWRKVLLDAAVDARAEVQLHMEALLRARVFGRIFVQHDDHLGHVIQFRHLTDVIHGTAPLFVTLLTALERVFT